jgi:SSS family solute:Na+ symporter
MNLTWIDWAIVVAPLAATFWFAMWVRRYVSGVADFLAAGRAAGRYLICNARGEAAFGAVSAVAMFEMIYRAGFAVNWWGMIGGPVALFVALTGFVIYRFRETRALTLAQFFEMRYSRGFRVFAGILAFVSGMVNYGIFPAVGARFFVYFCGFPESFVAAGLRVPTFAVVMALFLATAVVLTNLGGQLSIMITDCVEGILSGILYLVVIFGLYAVFSWDQISSAMIARPAGESMFNPFDTSSVKDFNLWYVLMGLVITIYGTMAWQGNQGFNCAAANPHEAKMGGILGNWRGFARGVMIVLLGICAFTFLNHADFAAGAAKVNATLAGIDNPQIATQMRVPVALGEMLPLGIKGAFCAIMLFALLACDGSYLHSWGSIFIQDVVLPLRGGKPLEPAQHIRWLRGSIIGVAVFAFFFSLLFRQTEYIFMFFAITGAIFLGGAGAVIIGGLYWKKGTAAGAWAGMITGSTLSVASIVIRQIDPQFPLNGQVLAFLSMLGAIVAYVAASLATGRGDYDLDRLLHRGKYAVAEDQVQRANAKPRTFFQKALGFDEHFTRGDKIVSGGLFAWSMFWFGVFIVVTTWNLIGLHAASLPAPFAWMTAWTTSDWATYYHFAGILLPLAIGIVTTVWFTIGGIADMFKLFRTLDRKHEDAADDGTVQESSEPENKTF